MTFFFFPDVERILQIDLPEFKQATLIVEAFYEALGVAGVCRTISDTMPAPFVINVKLSVTEYIMKHKIHRSRLDRETQNANVRYVWPHDNDQRKLRIEPVVGTASNNTWTDWENRARKLLESFYCQYHAEVYIPKHEKYLESMKKHVTNVCRASNIDIKIVIQGQKEALLLRGLKENVPKAKLSLDSLLQELEKKKDEEEKKMSEKVTDFSELAPYKIKQLKMCRVVEKLRRNNPDVNITIPKDGRQIMFEGTTEAAVINAKMKMTEILDNLTQQCPPLNLLRQRFILQAEKDILEIFEARNIRATCVANNIVKITAETEGDAHRALEFLQEELQGEQIPFSNTEELSVLQDRAGAEFIKDLNIEYPTALSHFDNGKQCLEITGFRDAVATHKDNVAAYVEANATKDVFMELPEGKVAYLQSNFDTKEIPQSVRISWSFEPTPKIVFSGKPKDTETAKQVVEAYIQKIVEKSHRVSRTGILALHKDQAFITPIQQKCKCYIKIKDNEKRRGASASTGTFQHPKPLQQYPLETGQILMICLGDITKENVDGIVNAANPQMKHEGGVAEAIVNSG